MLARIDKIQYEFGRNSKESIRSDEYGTILKDACRGLDKTLRLTNALHVAQFSCILYMKNNQ
ncbi:MAG TPA: hypothetical protein VIY98_08300 [Nitrososphaeraceae archaeon]